MALRKASDWRRLWRHLATDRRDVDRAFPPAELSRVESAIAAGERRHSGQVCFAIEGALPLARVWQRVAPRERALEVFGLLRVWDTERNNGVLVYLLLADRDVEIVADRGIHSRVGDAAWEAVCRKMESAFRAGRFAEGVEQGIAAIADLLAQHSPPSGDQRNELSDRPIIL
ncbi:MAG: TPM domain-containing protein [Burkholderiales bacterium]